VNEQLEREVEELRSEGLTIEVTYDAGWIHVVLRDYQLPRVGAFTRTTADILVKLPLSYPNGQPDMFWTSVDLALRGGSAPQSAEAIETALGREWRRWSWHPKTWNPARDNLRTYIAFINARLAKAL
jgi:hypothetical protein